MSVSGWPWGFLLWVMGGGTILGMDGEVLYLSVFEN